VAWTLESSSGIRPVDTQKSTVPDPRPCRFGARVVPSASGPWQLEQLEANSAAPGFTNDLGSVT
jgi:hypothetical protein